MKIILNQKETAIEEAEQLNVQELLQLMKFSFPLKIVKLNGQLIRKENYPTSLVHPGDRVEVIHLMGGG